MSSKADAIIVRRVPAPPGARYRDALIAIDNASAEAIAKFPLGDDIVLKRARERSLPQHRLFWSVLQHVAASSQWETPERLLIALKIRLGRYDLMQLPNGKVVPVPQSISFAAMSQDDFQHFMDESIRVICAEVLGGYDAAQLISEVEFESGTPEKLGSAA